MDQVTSAPATPAGAVDDGERPSRRDVAATVRVAAVVVVSILVPFLVAGWSLTRERWYPVLDMAMTEFRVRDVGTTDTPLIGLPGRIGRFPEQGSHPGPWSFYLLAPFHWVTGGRAFGLQLGSLVVNAALSLGIVGLLARAGRSIGHRAVFVAAGATLVGLALRGYGFDLLGHPWNPYFPLLVWIGVLLATWCVLDGDPWPVVFVVAGGSIAAQTHVPYLLLAIAMVLTCAVALWLTARRDGVHSIRTPATVAVGVGAVLWLPPLVEQVTAGRGNVSMLVEHFAADPPEEAIGLGRGAAVLLRHLDLPGAVWAVATGDEGFVELSGRTQGVAVGGVVTLVVWLVAIALARRWRHTSLLRLHAVTIVATVVGYASMTRIFGAVWFYLTLWAWGTLLVVALSLAWTAVVLVRSIRGPSPRIRHAAVSIAAVVTLGAWIAPIGQRPPDAELSQGLGAVLPDTIAALDEGRGPAPGPDATYVVFWQDATFIGAQGYGMVNELERAGFDVGVHPTWRVPVTPHRVVDAAAIDAEIHVVTGSYIDRWRAEPSYVEVAWADPRSDAERDEYARLRETVDARLVAVGHPEIAALLDVNLFGALLDTREADLDDSIAHEIERMLAMSQPIAVFLTPPGNSS